jgi:hypothetical protein
MNQALRGLADTALGPGVNVSSRISIHYAPPGAWSHGYLWGADTVSIPDAASFAPKTKPTDSVSNTPGGVAAATNATAFALALDSATAVRTLNGLLADGVTAELATVPFTNATGEQMPAGTVLLPASAQNVLASAGAAAGVWFTGVTGTLPTREPLTAPRIAVLAGGVTQEIWSLRNLGFTADPVSTATINSPDGSARELRRHLQHAQQLPGGHARECGGSSPAGELLCHRRRLRRRADHRCEVPDRWRPASPS